jgi:hypothetical protein
VRLAVGGKRAKRRAIVAVARKLAVLMHHLWLTGDDYVALREAVPVKDRLLSHGSA